MKNILKSLLLLFLATSCNETLKTTTPISKMDKLLLGNQRFLNNQTLHPRQNKKAILATENSQHPFAVIISCADSRVSPEIIFDQGIGDLFVVRNAGNLMSDYAMGSVEYAVEHLQTKLIIVLGHTECGAIKAYIENIGSKKNNIKHDHIETIINTIKNEEEEKQIPNPSKNNIEQCIKANIKHSANKIMTNEFINQKTIEVVSMIYDIHTGKVSRID